MELIGPFHALTGVWLIIIQHGFDAKISDPDEVAKFLKAKLGRSLSEVKWTRSSINVIEDASDALREYRSFPDESSSRVGAAYLRFFGALGSVYQLAAGIKSLWSLYRANEYSAIADRIESHRLYDLRNRLGAHMVNYKRDKSGPQHFHVITQMDMFRRDGKRSFVASDLGYQEFDMVHEIVDCEKLYGLVLLELTALMSAKVITRRSDHFEWSQERIEFARRTFS